MRVTMLSTNQINVLKHIVDNDESFIIDLAEEQGISNSLDSVGIGRFIIADPKNFSQMSGSQKYHYDNAIKPLIVDVLCDGMIGQHEDGSSSCIGNDFIDEETLLLAYQTDDMRCQQCISTTEQWIHNNP